MGDRCTHCFNAAVSGHSGLGVGHGWQVNSWVLKGVVVEEGKVKEVQFHKGRTFVRLASPRLRDMRTRFVRHVALSSKHGRCT